MAETFDSIFSTPAENNNRVGTIESMLSGVASGLIAIPKGFFSLGASLMDLGVNSGKAAAVEQWFDDLTEFDEKAEATAAGKITEALVNIGIPGGIAFKSASGLAKASMLAGRNNKYVKLNKELKGNTTAEIIQARMLKDEMPTGSNLAGLISINNPELNIKVLPTKDLGNADPIDYMTKIVTAVNADVKTPNYPAGVYVLKDKVIQITEEGSVIPVPINALK